MTPLRWMGGVEEPEEKCRGSKREWRRVSGAIKAGNRL